jgi:methyl-accepting chemotaxis protein
MFKNLALATKMAFGFGIVVLIAAVVGLTGWKGLSGVDQKANLFEMGNESLAHANKTGVYRRDFAIKGFAKAPGEEKNAAEKWQASYEEMQASLQKLQGEKGLSRQDKQNLQEAQEVCKQYAQSFEKQKAAQQAKLAGMAQWKKSGDSITRSIQGIIETVLEPARETARQSGKPEEIVKWSDISTQLDGQVIRPFLLLRNECTRFLAVNSDEQHQVTKTSLQTLRGGLAEWGRLVKGESKLEKAAEDLAGYFTEYEGAGEKYYSGILAQRQADSEMAERAGKVMAAIIGVQESLRGAMESIITRSNILMVVLSLAGIVLGIIIATVITLGITKPVHRIIEGLSAGSEQVTSASTQVAGASQEMAEGSSEQASSLEETSSSLEEMSSMTKQNADNANQADGAMKAAGKQVEQGVEAMTRMSSAIDAIQASSGETAKIIKTIDEIAFQTNLLALNAAVEAARAGEAGKGFAVVAEEVRNLAQRSAEAARNTSDLIEESQKNAEAGVNVAEEVAKNLTGIQEGAGKVGTLIAEIAAASKEQAQGIEQVNLAVAEMDKVVQRNAANAEESASASEELSSQAQELNAMVADLVTIVDGTNGQKQRTVQAPRQRSTVKRPQVAAPAKPVSHKPQLAAKSVDPEQVIPLDDDEFADF